MCSGGRNSLVERFIRTCYENMLSHNFLLLYNNTLRRTNDFKNRIKYLIDIKWGNFMRKLLFVLIGLILLTFVGCSEKVTGAEKIAEDYVKSQGYNITDRKGEIQKYTLEKSKLYGATETLLYQQMWAVQMVEPDKYFGKEIVIYGFTVKNHPMQKRDKNAKNGVNVYIMLSEGKVIGGYSYPNANVFGAYSSIDGKTLEEITGLSYQEWLDNWKKKYGN